MKTSKHLLTLLLALILLLSGCGGEGGKTTNTTTKPTTDNTSDATTTTTAPTTTTTTTTTATDSIDDIGEDVLVMLEYLIEAEELYGRINDIIGQYNDDVLSIEDTAAKLKDEQKILETFVATTKATEWKSNRYKKTRSQALSGVLHQLEIFFEASIEGFETKSNTLLYKADTYLSSYCTLSANLHNDVSRDYR